jgi:hypothetical protein
MSVRSLAALVLIAPLAACAGGPASGERYVDKLDSLAADCRDRGGILSPSGAQTGDPARDNVCKINGEPARAGR